MGRTNRKRTLMGVAAALHETDTENLQRRLNAGSRPARDAVRIEELINYFSNDYLRLHDRTRPFRHHCRGWADAMDYRNPAAANRYTGLRSLDAQGRRSTVVYAGA